MKKKLFAITDMEGVFLKKMEVNSKTEIQKYLNQKYSQGISLTAWELSTSKRKLTKSQLQQLDNFINRNDYNLSATDLNNFKRLLKKLQQSPAAEGMIIVNQYFDTFLRELIPPSIWKAMMGELKKK
ncbi:hypothetical protein [Aquimarina agarilytica]|uniref:hypothetical protein n=1 Tax=Aquimarina agarilytica TaxID=1087449 RepID=UPI0002892606|nr:hypothetical protein [Aquimarina agarilytica]